MSKTILLADDSLTIQKVVELTFADTEYAVVSLSSGDDLLQKLDEVSPDLVICDIIMPGRDGYDVCQEIKSDPATLHIPVILLSGTFEPFDRDRALAAGCSEIITKPFEARKLVDTVEKLLVGEVSDTATIAEEAVTPTAEVPAASDPDMQTLESFPPYVEEPDTATADALGGEELPESDLEFTDTGFAEMEEAARQGEQVRSEIPEDGLDFEFSDEHEAFGTTDSPEPSDMPEAAPEFEAEASVETATDIDPFAEPETTNEDEAFGDLREMPEFERMAEDVPEPSEVVIPEPPEAEFASPEEPSLASLAGPDVVTDSDEPEPFPVTGPADGMEDSAVTDSEPFESEGAAEEHYESFAVSPETVEIPRADLLIDEPADVESVQDDRGEDEIVVDVAFEREIEARPDIEPVFESHPSTDQPPGEEETTTPGADTGPVPAEMIPQSVERSTEEPFRHPEPVPSGQLDEAHGLSDEDVDRIARRVLELASDRFEQLAWEIVPDMAEIAVRQRIRELETEVEESSDDEPR